MGFVPQGSIGHTSQSNSSQPTPEWLWPTIAVVAILGLMAWGTIPALTFLSSLLFAAAAGLAIGWVRQAFSRKSRFGESMISALFGGSLARDPSRLVFLDLLVRVMAGYAVGLVFAGFGIMNSDASNPFIRGMAGGAGGGPDIVGLTLLAVVLLLVAVVIGLLVILAVGNWADIVLNDYLFDASAIAKLAVTGAVKGTIKDAVIAYEEWGSWRIKPSRSAAKGAVTGVLVGML